MQEVQVWCIVCWKVFCVFIFFISAFVRVLLLYIICLYLSINFLIWYICSWSLCRWKRYFYIFSVRLEHVLHVCSSSRSWSGLFVLVKMGGTVTDQFQRDIVGFGFVIHWIVHHANLAPPHGFGRSRAIFLVICCRFRLDSSATSNLPSAGGVWTQFIRLPHGGIDRLESKVLNGKIILILYFMTVTFCANGL